jgi:hypothetical protein
MRLDIDSLMAGDIDPSGECWHTERDVSCGPMVVARAFAESNPPELTHEGHRSPPESDVGERSWGRDPDRIPMILAALERVWRDDTDSRLGQLLVNLLRRNANIPREDEGRVLFTVEDGELLGWIGPRTEQEENYVREEPRKAHEGWRAWERDFVERERKRRGEEQQ